MPPFQQRNRRPEGPRVNHRIRISPIRVILEDGTQQVMSTSDALILAQESGLDLVEISPTANPPVCKIVEYGKWKYDQAKKANEAKKNSFQAELKQIRFRPKTDEHDRAFKIKNTREFLEEGHKVHLEVRYKGRENAHPEVGIALLDGIALALADIAKVERAPKYEGRSTVMIVVPK